MRAWVVVTTERTRVQREKLAAEISRIQNEALRSTLRSTMSRLFMFIEDDLERWSARTAGVGLVLPMGILREDSCIIDEQENHIVLTLRLPIDAIRDNLALLMALCEIGKRPPAEEPEDGDLDDAEGH